MKTPFLRPAIFAALAIAACPAVLLAQDYPPPPPPPGPGAPAGQARLEQLPSMEQLVAPIALYPDPIIALMLPAATMPDQLVAAAGNPSNPNFDPSIQGLEHYPEVLRWMASNITWTQQLGGAFASSPADVMSAIQALRQQARNAGTLAPSNYETIQVDASGQIQILPVQPDQIYIPSYDPSVVYWGEPGMYPGSYFAWSEPYPAGSWLSFDFDWGRHAIWHGNWYAYHREYGWNRPIDFGRYHGGHGGEWRPPSNHPPAPGFERYAHRGVGFAEPRAEYRGGGEQPRYAPGAAPAYRGAEGQPRGGYAAPRQGAPGGYAHVVHPGQPAMRAQAARSEPARSAPTPSGDRDHHDH